MISIGTRTFADGPAKYVALANAEMVRPLPCGKYWGRLRIAVRWAVNYTLTDNMSPSCYFGVCVGPNGVSNGNVTLTYGLTMQASNYSGATFAYVAASGLPYIWESGGLSYASARAGYALTSTSGIGGGDIYWPVHQGATTLRRSLTMLDLIRSGNNVTVYAYSMNMSLAAQNVDVTAADLQEALSSVTYRSTALSGNTSNTVAANESTYGYADHFTLFWGSELYPLEVYEVGVYRLG